MLASAISSELPDGVIPSNTQSGNIQLQTCPASPVSSPCDMNGDGTATVVDVQIVVNQALGVVTPCTADVNQDHLCNVIDVQRVANAALGGACLSP